MFNEIIDNSENIKELESQFLDTSRPFQIVIDNINQLFIPVPDPASRKILVFDDDQRYQSNFGLHPAYTLSMPLLNYWYGAFLEEIQNNPVLLGKIRFESLGSWRGVALIPNIQQFGSFLKYNSNNVGDSVQTSMDTAVFLNQTLPNTIDWYGDFKIDGLTSMIFNFPTNLAALRITCYMKKSASLKEMLLTGKLFKNYFPVPDNLLSQKELLTLTNDV